MDVQWVAVSEEEERHKDQLEEPAVIVNPENPENPENSENQEKVTKLCVVENNIFCHLFLVSHSFLHQRRM